MANHQTIEALSFNEEKVRLILCSLGAFVYVVLALYWPTFYWPFSCLAMVFLFQGIRTLIKTRKSQQFKRKTLTRSQPFMTHKVVIEKFKDCVQANVVWMGEGFFWEQSHRQCVNDILKSDWQQAYAKSVRHEDRRKRLKKINNHSSKLTEQTRHKGLRWIHATGDEEDIHLPLAHFQGHTLALGGSGAGKSRFLDILIVQAIARGETVIMIDPKGDHGLNENMQWACNAFGRKADFMSFHLSRPETSIRLNPLANFISEEDLASRITSVLPNKGGASEAFNAMGHANLAAICKGMRMLGEKPTIKSLLHYYLNNPAFGEKALSAYIKQTLGQEAAEPLLSRLSYDKLEGLTQIIEANGLQTPETDAVVNFATQTPDFIKERTSVTIGLLERLAAGSLGDLLSPENLPDDFRPVTDFNQLIRQKKVVYIGLAAMKDPMVASSVGAMLLSDLTAVAGSRYDFEKNPSPIFLVVDEASEVMCESFIQLLNKGRGAGFVITIATQTISDFTSRMGKLADTSKVLANVNTLVALRCNDEETRTFFSRHLPSTKVAVKTQTLGVSTTAENIMAQSGNIGERLQEQDTELVPPALLGGLPDLEYFAIVSGGYLIKGRVPILVEKAQDYRENS